MLRKIAGALGCTVADLYAGTEPANVVSAPMGLRRIPLISHVQAGMMTEAVDPYVVGDAADWLVTDLESFVRGICPADQGRLDAARVLPR